MATGRMVARTYFDSQGRTTRQEDRLSQALVTIDYMQETPHQIRMVNENGKVIADTYTMPPATGAN
jgi:hypothetical protein